MAARVRARAATGKPGPSLYQFLCDRTVGADAGPLHCGAIRCTPRLNLTWQVRLHLTGSGIVVPTSVYWAQDAQYVWKLLDCSWAGSDSPVVIKQLGVPSNTAEQCFSSVSFYRSRRSPAKTEQRSRSPHWLGCSSWRFRWESSSGDRLDKFLVLTPPSLSSPPPRKEGQGVGWGRAGGGRGGLDPHPRSRSLRLYARWEQMSNGIEPFRQELWRVDAIYLCSPLCYLRDKRCPVHHAKEGEGRLAGWGGPGHSGDWGHPIAPPPVSVCASMVRPAAIRREDSLSNKTKSYGR